MVKSKKNEFITKNGLKNQLIFTWLKVLKNEFKLKTV